MSCNSGICGGCVCCRKEEALAAQVGLEAQVIWAAREISLLDINDLVDRIKLIAMQGALKTTLELLEDAKQVRIQA